MNLSELLSSQMVLLVGLPILALFGIVGLWALFRLAQKKKKQMALKPTLPNSNTITINTATAGDSSSSGKSDLMKGGGQKVATNAQPVVHDIGGGVEVTERERVLIKRITENPVDVEAYELLGQLYMTQNNFVDARDCFMQILAIKPNHPKASKQLRRIKKLK